MRQRSVVWSQRRSHSTAEREHKGQFGPDCCSFTLKGVIIRVASHAAARVVLVDEAAEPVATADLALRRSLLSVALRRPDLPAAAALALRLPRGRPNRQSSGRPCSDPQLRTPG